MESRCQQAVLSFFAIYCIGQKFCDFLRAWHKSWRFLLLSRALYAVRIMCIDFSCSLGKSCRFTAVTFPSSSSLSPVSGAHSIFFIPFIYLSPSLSLSLPLSLSIAHSSSVYLMFILCTHSAFISIFSHFICQSFRFAILANIIAKGNGERGCESECFHHLFECGFYLNMVRESTAFRMVCRWSDWKEKQIFEAKTVLQIICCLLFVLYTQNLDPPELCGWILCDVNNAYPFLLKRHYQ